MTFINETDRRNIAEILERMAGSVKLIHFTQAIDCETCGDTRGLLEELAPISDRLSLEVLNFALDKEKAAEYGVDKVPATVIEANGKRVRYYGIPAGYEFASLLDAIVLVSSGDSELTPESRAQIASVTTPMHLEVLVTPT